MSRRVTVIVEGREYIVEVGDLDESPIKATVNQRTYHVEVPPQNSPSAEQVTTYNRSVPETQESAPSHPAAECTTITAPMPGNILEVRVKVGDRVNRGDVVCVLEAMKMKNLIHANLTGVVASVEVTPGQTVDFGAVLVTIE